MRFSLSTKLILSMAGMVFLTALACSLVFMLIINNQTREFETRLEQSAVPAEQPLPALEIAEQLKCI